jgi:hypothetical protein
MYSKTEQKRLGKVYSILARLFDPACLSTELVWSVSFHLNKEPINRRNVYRIAYQVLPIGHTLPENVERFASLECRNQEPFPYPRTEYRKAFRSLYRSVKELHKVQPIKGGPVRLANRLVSSIEQMESICLLSDYDDYDDLMIDSLLPIVWLRWFKTGPGQRYSADLNNGLFRSQKRILFRRWLDDWLFGWHR